jgi:hypothetical protein
MVGQLHKLHLGRDGAFQIIGGRSMNFLISLTARDWHPIIIMILS